MMARKLLTKTFINILKTNLVSSRPKYGILSMMIAESLIQPSKPAPMALELACILSPRGSAAMIYKIPNRRVPEKAQKVIEADADT